MMISLMKVLGAILSTPLLAAMLVGVAGVVVRNRPGASRRLFICAALLAYLCSNSVIAGALLGSLERQYPPLQPGQVADVVVVLGSGYQPHDAIPITAALDQDGLVRIVEGIRLARRQQNVRLVVSGGAPAGQPAPARGYAELARSLGIEESRLVVLSAAQDTAAEARAIGQLLGSKPFILVTSAYHMPRAVRQMIRAGAVAIPAPTGQMTGGPTTWRRWLPTSGGLGKCERALHEYLGIMALDLGFG
jgi:uncharacterized SAM-binding protein YcdF (DUF218 family)